MGFKISAKRYRLTFPQPDLDGFEVVCRASSMGAHMALSDMIDDPDRDTDTARELFAQFVNLIIEWNLEDDDGQPVAVSVDALLGMPPDAVWAMVFAYLDAVAGVPAPLDRPSDDGGQPPEASIPMVVSTASRAS